MEFEKILQEITSGLTGDSSVDLPYLQQKMRQYENHPLQKEIQRACGRLMVQITPADKKAEMDRSMQNEFMAWDATLEEVRFHRYKKEPEKALELLKSLVDKADGMLEIGMFADDTVSEYHYFFELYEEILYRFFEKPERTLRRPGGIPLPQLYLEYGSILIDLQRVDEAQQALAKAVRWNPVNSDIAFEYAETFKVQGNMEQFCALTRQQFRYAYRPKQLARCYRNMGFYFVERQLWQEAMACFLLSLQYDPDSKNAQLELYYIQDQTKGKVRQPDAKRIHHIAETNGFPMGPDRDVVGLAYTLGKQGVEEQNAPMARYYLQIVYDLTEWDEIKTMLDALPAEE